MDPKILAAIAAIGLDSVSEAVTDAAGNALADAAGGVAQTERVKRFLTGVLGGLSPAQLNALQKAVRWGGRITSSALKALARRVMAKNAVAATIQHAVIDSIDDLVEILARRTEDSLSPAEVAAYVSQAVDQAAANPTPFNPATAGHLETPMQDFHIPEGARELGPEIAEIMHTMGPLGSRRCARLYQIRKQSRYHDPEQELDGASTIEEAMIALFAVNPSAACAMLDDDRLEENTDDVREDVAVLKFLDAAERYLPNPSLAARLRDHGDAMVDGSTRRVIVFGVQMSLLAFGALLLGSVASAAFFFVLGGLTFVWGAWGEVVNGVRDIQPGWIAFGAGLLLVGCLPLALFGYLKSLAEKPFELMGDAFRGIISTIRNRFTTEAA